MLMRAFILRRVALIARGLGDATLIGSAHNAGTLRLQEFFTRNGHPYAYLDVDRDDAVQAMLDRFHVGVGDVPIVICRGEKVLKNPTNEEVADCFGLSTATSDPSKSATRRRRRGSRRARGRGVRRLRRARRARARDERAGRASGDELEDRELPRLPHGHLGAGARGARVHAGGEVRRGDRRRAHGAAPRVRRQGVRDRPLERRGRAREARS